MTLREFIAKWDIRFADNDFFLVDEADLREFKDDLAQLIGAGSLSGRTLTELALPMAVTSSGWYLTSTGIWEARRDFTANAYPVAGPNWRLVVHFGSDATAASIIDASPAGRSMLTAANATVQLSLVDKLAIEAGKYGAHPAFTRAYTEQGLLVYLLQKVLQPAPAPVVTMPDAPTAGQVDDKGDTFSFKTAVNYPSFAQYQVSGLPQTTGAEWLNGANSYVQGDRIYVRVVGAVDVGGLAVYVGPSGSVPAGRVLTNDKPFTANNVAPAVPGALALEFSIDNATLSPGDTLTFTAKASGGTAPYQHSVQALNPDTGVVTALGTASTATYIGTWPKVPAGVYLVTDALTDAAGASLVSSARRVVVAVPGSSGGAMPLVPATRTRLGGVKVGEGLSIDTDGLLTADSLLDTANTWPERQTFSSGIRFYNGAGFDEYGQLSLGQILLADKFLWRGGVQKMASDVVVGWSPNDYAGQANGPDVALGRVSAGVLEVNTGTAGQLATLSVLDVLVSSVQNVALNTFSKLAAFVQGLVARLGSTTSADPAATTSSVSNVLARVFGLSDRVDLLAKQIIRWDQERRVTLVSGGGNPAYVSGQAFVVVATTASSNGNLFSLAAQDYPRQGDLVGVRVRADSIAVVFKGLRFGSPTGPLTFDGVPGQQYIFHACTDVAGDITATYWQVHSAPSSGASYDDTGIKQRLGATTAQDPAAPLSAVKNVLSQTLTLADAQGMVAARTLLPGRTYIVDFGPDANDKSQIVYASALQANLFNRYVTVITDNATISQALANFKNGVLEPVATGGGASTFGQLGGAPRENAALATELDAVNSLTDGRRDLVTIASNRFNDLVLERKVTLSALKLATNVSSIAAQVLAEGTTAVSSPRTGSPADLLAALQADINGLASWSYYIIRVQTTPVVSTDVTHVLITLSA